MLQWRGARDTLCDLGQVLPLSVLHILPSNFGHYVGIEPRDLYTVSTLTTEPQPQPVKDALDLEIAPAMSSCTTSQALSTSKSDKTVSLP